MLESNRLTGTLPDSWGRAGAFEELQGLDLADNFLSGEWPGTLSAAAHVANSDCIWPAPSEA